jgi:S1-C subfamily serine protease
MYSHLALVQGETTVTAFAIAPDLFAAVDPGGKQPFRLTMTNGQAVDVATVSHDRRSNLVLLRPVTPFKADPVTLSSAHASRGLAASGYAAQLDGTNVVGAKTSGVLEDDTLGDEGLLIVKTSASVPPGGVGGPLLDAKNQVVGIAIQTATGRRYASASLIQLSVRALAENSAYVASLKLP